MGQAIKIRGLKKYFGKLKAVDGIDLTIEQGEIFGFLGPNGAGKTTTIRCMMDFLHPTEGKIEIMGLDAQKDAVKLKKQIGYLIPASRLYENWTALEHFRFYQHYFGPCESLPTLIKTLDLNPEIKIKNLSSGNRQKVALILAFFNNPKVVIMDEPTVGLDPILQNQVYRLMKTYVQKGVTIFMSSHNLPEVENICQRVGIIKEGKLVAVENIRNLVHKKIHLVKVCFQKPIEIDFALEGVKVKESLDNTLILNVTGEIAPLLRKLAQYPLKDIEITHASLEDIFLEYYRQ